MIRVGQKLKTVLGYPVEIIAILEKPTDEGFCVVGVKTNGDGELEIESFRANGRAGFENKPSFLDLVLPPEIQTRGVFPPIPTHDFDYVAWYSDQDDENGSRGWGPTPEEAIADLKESYPREEEQEAA